MNTAVDEEHCGKCDFACFGRQNSLEGTCADSGCSLTCVEGFADCDEDVTNGCEVELDRDDEHCGECGTSCHDLPGVAEGRCVDSVCQVHFCEEDRDDCDGDPANGCETDLTGLDNCGGCFRSCHGLPQNLAEPACIDGSCALECAEGWLNCDGDDQNGCEAFVDADPMNCGTCGNACEEGESCFQGRCHDPDAPHWPMPADSPDPDDYEVFEETVVDSHTGLEWQRELPPGMPWADALEFCPGLELAGKGDWRLPSVLELFTILDYGTFSPSIHGDTFPGTPNTNFWPKNPYVSRDGNGWAVNFQYGTSTFGAPAAEFRVRCVRGGDVLRGPRFEVDEDAGTVTDLRTKLMWERAPSETATNLNNQVSACAGRETGGFDDWRVPYLKELISIVHFGKHDPAIDEGIFPDTPSADFWSQTRRANQAAQAWAVSFESGNVLGKSANFASYVRCVRTHPSP